MPEAGRIRDASTTGWVLGTGHRDTGLGHVMQADTAAMGSLRQQPAPEEADWPCLGHRGPLEGLGAVRAVSPARHPHSSPVELEHAAGEGHAPRHLEGHPPDEVHLLAAVRVEG